MNSVRPTTLAIVALGGQGGGVVADWLVDIARRSNYLAQATSVPGVAQRTGATIYYLEFFPVASLPAARRRPIFALMPNPGDVDVVIASEIMEAGRALQRGIVTEHTTLIASSHRIYSINEKTQLTDGRADSSRVRTLARRHARRFIEFDMQAMAEAHGSVISAAMLGAVCGSGALPFSADVYIEAIRGSGVEVDASIRTFESAKQAAAAAAPTAIEPIRAAARSPVLGSLQTRLPAFLPQAVQDTVRSGVARMIDYQDLAYAVLYLDRLDPIIAIDRNSGVAGFALTECVARGLALWMSFEDTIRVADLKIRAARTQRLLQETRHSMGELVQVTEFMKPRVEEICGTLPIRLGTWLLHSERARRWLSYLIRDRQIGTSTIAGFLQLYWLAGLRRLRRKTLRYSQEQARIGDWLGLIGRLAPQRYDLALEVASCQQLIKGYGDTHSRGLQRFDAILAKARSWREREDAPSRIRALIVAASADEEGREFAKALATST